GGHTGGGSTSNDADLSRVQEALRTLRTSGYYYEGLSWQEADRLLRDRAVGTFLVRDSSDNRFLFALSVQTERGPTSARIHYRKGQFRLDSEDALSSCMPWFSCVVRLVEHYVQLSRSAKGQMPLYRELLPLQHLCRLALNRAAASAGPANAALATMPAALRDYVNDYPHLH
ncbi:suppressor of cytokine signaling-2, putative, partial [Ixodes scapularis]